MTFNRANQPLIVTKNILGEGRAAIPVRAWALSRRPDGRHCDTKSERRIKVNYVTMYPSVKAGRQYKYKIQYYFRSHLGDK